MLTLIKNIDRLNKVIFYIIGIMLIVMSATIAYQVFSRFALGASLSWSEELARYLMAWVVFMGAALAIRKGELIGVEAIVDLSSDNIKKVLKLLVCIVCIAFSIFLIVKGIEMVQVVENQRSPAMRIPMTYVYASIPVSGVLMALNSIVVAIELFRKDGEK
ncbi:TRAP transporter small permease [Halalkalibacter oceani]|uniref:TRAP transporter small permease n=1 Tax=Halalkalibacter oceani TaxID=1653776 RepID=UPI0033949F4A